MFVCLHSFLAMRHHSAEKINRDQRLSTCTYLHVVQGRNAGGVRILTYDSIVIRERKAKQSIEIKGINA